MSIKEYTHPTARYVNAFLLDMTKEDGEVVRTVRRSGALPVMAAFPALTPATFERFRNRLKVMADLDPVIYQSTRSGSFEIMVPRELDGKWYGCHYTISVLFDDIAPDPCLAVRSQLKSRESGFDPAECLF